MTLSKKSKTELIAELKKLQRTIRSFEKSQTSENKHTLSILSDLKWQSFFRNSQNIILVVDRRGIILDINSETKQVKKKDIVGKSAYSFVSDEDLKRMKLAIEKVFKTKKAQEYNVSRPDNDLGSRHYKTKATAAIKDKKVVAVILDSTETTKEVKSALLLKESEARFKALAENALDIVFRYQIFPEYKHEYISPSVKKITGYSQQDFLKDPLLSRKIVHHDDLHILDELKKQQKDKNQKDTELKQNPLVLRWIKKNGEVIWTETVNNPVLNNKGLVVAIEGISRDITKRKEAEMSLFESEEKFKKLSDAAFEGIVIHKDGKIIDVNNALKNTLRFSEKEIINQSFLKFIHPDYHKTVSHNFNKKIDAAFDVKMLRKGNTFFWAELLSTEIVYKGKPLSVTSIRDISKHKENEQIIKNSEEDHKHFLEQIPSGVIIYVGSDVVFANRSAFEILGIKHQELSKVKTLNIYDYILPKYQKDTKERALRILNGEILDFSEICIKSPKGEILDIEIKSKLVLHNGKKAVQTIFNNISFRKQGEKILKESEERFKILSNATFEGIVFSENGKIIDANDQFLKMYGFKSSKEIIGKNLIDDFVVEEQKLQAKKHLRLSTSKLFEVDTIKKDGTIITVESKGQNIPYFEKNIRATVIYNITDRKQNELNLRESERTLSTLMNSLPGMAYRCENDENLTMLFVSNGFQALTGYKPKDILQNKKISFSEITHPEHRKSLKSVIQKALRTKSPFEIEYQLINASGQAKWVWEKGEGVFSDDGKLLFIEGFITDINEKKQFELELKRSRENYKSLVDYSPDGVIIHIDGVMKFANPSGLKIVGVNDFEELENISALDFILPEYHKQTIERISKVKAGEDLDFVEIKIKNKKGEIVVLETKPTIIKFNGIEAIQVVFHDTSEKKLLLKEQARAQIAEETNELLEQEITKRKVIQLKLQESQKYTRLIINGSLDMICASDRQGFITEFNQAAQQTFGYSQEEVIGKHVSMLYEDPKERKKITDDELYSKGAYAGEVTNRRKNGEKFIAFLSASVLKNDDGEVIGAMGVSRDISELKQAEGKLRKQSAKFNAIIETSSHLIWTVDKNICLTTFNQNLDKELKTRYGREAKIGLSMIPQTAELQKEYNSFLLKKYEKAFAGEPQYFDIYFTDKNGLENWREIYLNPIWAEDGSVLEVSGISHDITEKKISEERIRLSLQEKEVLLKEVHHRVKNNLQVISSILNLQSSYVKDEGTLQILKESQNRIKSMAFIHESLYQTKDFSSINFTEYVVNLSQNLIHSYSNFDHEIKLNLDIQNVFLNLDLAIPCGLIINEIVSNALKYAFVDNSLGGEIAIVMKISGENLILNIGDNGRGLPPNIDYRNTESLGLQLVVTLTDQLSGTIALDLKKGTNYTIIFKQNQVKNRI
jgi:PAS domain S-box-containing protein